MEELGVRELRTRLADVVGDAIAGKTTYITHHGRRVAKIAPLGPEDRNQQPGGQSSPVK